MAVRMVIACDHCGNEPAETLTIDLGTGARDLDLCPDCQETYGIPKLTDLMNEYGVAPAKPPRATRVKSRPVIVDQDSEWPCPVCGFGSKTRTRAILHLAAIHDKTQVQASHMIPPHGRQAPAECPHCGFLATVGPGLAQHVQRTHPAPPPKAKRRTPRAKVTPEFALSG